ncbi:MAG: hypothetical protein GX657_02535 [Chloroflexi bacterium]|jgi:hypothetical protein|nr:hypothetical protein [Chloroflexota bacterium]
MDANTRRLLTTLGGLGLIALGLLTLVFQLLHIDFWSYAWPLFIMVPGLLFFVGMLSRGREAGGLAIPGTILTMLGLLFFYQMVFNQWQSWAYAWALLWPTAVGIGLVIQGLWSERAPLVESGKRLIRLGLWILLGGIVFFEGILGIGGWGLAARGLGAYLLPILLVAVGVGLLVRSLIRSRGTGAQPHGDSAEDLPPATDE